jgi:hypothetical protein
MKRDSFCLILCFSIHPISCQQKQGVSLCFKNMILKEINSGEDKWANCEFLSFLRNFRKPFLFLKKLTASNLPDSYQVYQKNFAFVAPMLYSIRSETFAHGRRLFGQIFLNRESTLMNAIIFIRVNSRLPSCLAAPVGLRPWPAWSIGRAGSSTLCHKRNPNGPNFWERIMRDLLSDLQRWRERGEAVALATVVKTWGSSPRPAGAKMAVNTRGEMLGSVSGGCVENAVIEEAQQVIQTGKPKLLTFGVSNEQAWEVGLACGGTIEVFVEKLEDWGWLLVACCWFLVNAS